MYAFTIHDSPLSEKCSDSLIAGMATLTTVTSTVSSSAARHSTTSASTCRRVHAKAAGVPDRVGHEHLLTYRLVSKTLATY